MDSRMSWDLNLQKFKPSLNKDLTNNPSIFEYFLKVNDDITSRITQTVVHVKIKVQKDPVKGVIYF